MPDKIAALLFDLDDTLFNRDKVFRSWTERFVRDHLLIEDDRRHKEVVDGIVRLDAHGYAPREVLFSKIIEEHPSLRFDVEQLIAAYREQFMHHICPAKETKQVLTGLVAQGIPFGIVTNGPDIQMKKIERLGLDRLTSCIFISEVFGCQKPDARIYLEAALCLKAEPREVLFVGDNPATDLVGAYGVGMKTAWLSHGQEWPAALSHFSADFTLESLGELLSILGIPMHS
jgi:putative hydrolase of the HAD superfamily